MHLESLRNNLEQVFQLPSDAVGWLCDLYQITQLLDDFADNDEVTRDTLDDGIYKILVTFPANQFYLSHSYALIPLVSNMVTKWKASDHLEKDGFADEKTYMWRAGYYDVVLQVITLVHGYKKSLEIGYNVLELYGESYREYKKEFPDA